MNASSAKLSVWVGQGVACIKIVGRANVTCSVDFKRLLNHLEQRGCGTISLELGECPLMDSTFLGTLARFACDHAAPGAGGGRTRVQLLNANDRVTEMLDNLCVLSLFTLSTGLPVPAGPMEPVRETADVSRQEVTRTALEAHLALTALSPSNEPKFKDVLIFFNEQLKALEGGAPPASTG